jgi:hypothetical protein
MGEKGGGGIDSVTMRSYRGRWGIGKRKLKWEEQLIRYEDDFLVHICIS